MAGPPSGMTESPGAGRPDRCPADDRDRRRRVGVVLLTAGGPDRDSAIEPFLCRYFCDPVNLGVPAPVRPLFARMMARRRRRAARRFYGRRDPPSPAGAAVTALAQALQDALSTNSDWSFRISGATRYWQPGVVEAAQDLVEAGVDRVIALPLSTIEGRATTRSWLAEWRSVWPTLTGDRPQALLPGLGAADPVLDALAALVRARPPGDRVLMVTAGMRTDGAWRRDPYARCARDVAAAVAGRAGLRPDDWALGFTGTAGPVPFTDPPAESLIRAATGHSLSILPMGTLIETAETALTVDLDLVPFAYGQGVARVTRLPVLAETDAGLAALAAVIREEAGNG